MEYLNFIWVVEDTMKLKFLGVMKYFKGKLITNNYLNNNKNNKN